MVFRLPARPLTVDDVGRVHPCPLAHEPTIRYTDRCLDLFFWGRESTMKGQEGWRLYSERCHLSCLLCPLGSWKCSVPYNHFPVVLCQND